MIPPNWARVGPIYLIYCDHALQSQRSSTSYILIYLELNIGKETLLLATITNFFKLVKQYSSEVSDFFL